MRSTGRSDWPTSHQIASATSGAKISSGVRLRSAAAVAMRSRTSNGWPTWITRPLASVL